MNKNDKKITEENFKKYFIENYESNVMQLREYYYRYSDNDESQDDTTFITSTKLIAEVATSTLGILIVAGFNLNIIAVLIAIFLVIIISFGFSFWYRNKNTGPKDMFKREYLTIEKK